MKFRRILAWLAITGLVALSMPAMAQETVVIGVVSDGSDDRLAAQQQIYVEELLALAGSEFDLEIRRFRGGWNKASIESAIEQAFADASIDMVLVTGFVGNQLAATRREFPKPTFLPIILDVRLLPAESVAGTSGVRNLSYLSAYSDFGDDLDTLRRITPYRKLVLMVDSGLSNAIPELRQAANAECEARGIELVEVTHDGLNHALMDQVPADADAVMVAGLPRMPADDFDRLVEAIAQAGLPSYSFAGVADVIRGLLATNTEPRDVERQARLNALNMQSVLLGARPEDQPVASQFKEQLTINMQTARRIGLSPSFDIMKDAVLLNQEERVLGEQFGLVEIVEWALRANRDLVSEQFSLQAGAEEIALARSNLLPQLSLGASRTQRKDSPLVASGAFAERSTDAVLNFDQLIYSDAASANLSIQKSLQDAREASFNQFRLDLIQAASTAYYRVLNAQTQLEVQENNLTITRANLELAKDRVELGTSSRADVYRWEAQAAQATILVVNARAGLNQSWDTLNRILNRTQDSRIALRGAVFDDPFVMSREEFDAMVASPADYARFSRLNIDRALRQSPEIASIDAQIAAKRREVTNQRRSYWLPDFALAGRQTSNLNQSGVGAGPGAGEDLDDWSISLQATLPLFAGGARKAGLSRARLDLKRLEALREATRERVEESIRRELHAAQAAYAQIDLSTAAADASRKNFELVSDAYARGTVSILELLDAQDTSVDAAAAAAESVYNFLITIMSMQRAIGGYDYLLSPEQRAALANEYRQQMSTGSER